MRIINMVMVLLVLIALTGCEAITGNKGGPPNPYYFEMKGSCGGDVVTLDGPLIGTKTFMYIDFETGNVNDEFDISILIDSPSVPAADRPIPLIDTVVFRTISTKPHSANGVKRAEFYLYAPCFSDGPYSITFVITDPHGDSGTFFAGFTIGESCMFASDPCKCVTQCGECTLLRYKLSDRCYCNCPLWNEKCE
ncbi:hypothetical protein J7L05_09090 [bacterium]|nr:hypothetical protein [bacterium]